MPLIKQYIYNMISITLAIGFFDKLLLWLDGLDKKLFLQINVAWTSPFFDSIFPWYRDANTWIPLYLFLLIFIFINFGWRAIFWVLFISLTATLSDQISSSFVKNWFARPRPCSDIFMQLQGRLILNRCPGSFSFTSSHATNHFAAAMFIFLTLKTFIKKWGYLFFFWAISVSYGQIYIGVHYPLDILGGALLGCFIGWCTGSFFNRRIGLTLLNNEPTT